MSPRGHAHSRGILAAVLALFMVACLCPEAASAAPAQPFTVSSVPNVHLADATQYVSDPAGLVPEQDKADINRYAADLQTRLGVELAVVVLKDVGDNEAREFATDLFNHWGLGQKGKDNGLLILLVTDPPQRSVIFETGYGLEGVLPDAIAYRLQQRYMIPDLQKGDWGKGLLGGVRAVRDYLVADAPKRQVMAAPVEGEPAEDDMSPGTALFSLLAIFALVFLFRRNPAMLGFLLGSLLGGRGGRGGWGGGGGGSWGGGSSGGGGSMSRF